MFEEFYEWKKTWCRFSFLNEIYSILLFKNGEQISFQIQFLFSCRGGWEGVRVQKNIYPKVI